MCMHARASRAQVPVVRAYTPICAPGARGHFTLALKVYRANVHKGFPQGGAMSQYLDGLQVMFPPNLELKNGITRVLGAH